METYNDNELENFLGCVAAGYTVDEACKMANLDHKKLQLTMLDLDLSRHVIDLSVWAGSKIRRGEIPKPRREDTYYADELDWSLFYRTTVMKRS